MTTPYAPAPLLAAIYAFNSGQPSDYTEITDPDESFVWIMAGPGEIQYYTDGEMAGQAWFLTWDRTHAVDHCEEVPLPDDGTPIEQVAEWLLSRAREIDEQYQ